jgi:hypothetical protein
MSVGNLLKQTTTVAAANDAATVFGLPSVGAVGIQITGTMTGTTISFEATVDNANWVALNCIPSNSGTAASSATAVGVWTVNSGGYASIRARCSTFASVSPVITVRYVGS